MSCSAVFGCKQTDRNPKNRAQKRHNSSLDDILGYVYEPDGFLSSSFTESIDLINSAMSPNLLGDSGFQSACI